MIKITLTDDKTVECESVEFDYEFNLAIMNFRGFIARSTPLDSISKIGPVREEKEQERFCALSGCVNFDESHENNCGRYKKVEYCVDCTPYSFRLREGHI